MLLQNSSQTDANLSRTVHNEQGFSILQIVVTLAVLSIISTFAVINIHSTRENLRLQNSVRQLAGYLEKARLDAIRRHGNSSVVFNSNSAYDVTMDFAGSGFPSTRTIPFESGVEIFSTLPNVTFNWRGRTQTCTISFAAKNSRGEQSWVDVSPAGDVTVNSDVQVLGTGGYNSIDTAAGVQSETIVTGTNLHNNSLDCPEDQAQEGPPISGGGPGCTDSADPSWLSIVKAGGSSGTIKITAAAAGTIVVSKPINLNVTPATQTVTAGSTVNFSVTSLNNTKGTFAVNFGTPCATLTVLVNVTNPN